MLKKQDTCCHIIIDQHTTGVKFCISCFYYVNYDRIYIINPVVFQVMLLLDIVIQAGIIYFAEMYFCTE